MKKKDLILEVGRNPKDNTSLDISIKANTFGFELYRVCLVLLDKMIEMGKELIQLLVVHFILEMII